MKKKLLYIAPDHLDFYKVVKSGLEKYSDYEVTMLISNSFKFEYKTFGHKAMNFFSKLFLKKNIKTIKFNEYFTEIINKYDQFDVLLMNRADMFDAELLELVTKKSNFSIVNYWDSFEKINGQLETMKYFDICYSFDKNDCEKYNLIKNNNFYYITDATKTPEFDLFFLGTFDSRFEKLKDIVQKIQKSNLKVHAKLFSKNKKTIKKNTSKNISFISEIIPFPESYKYNQNTKILIDIAHENQIGLSFRPFEAMGLRKKLITTNSKILEYDFYNPNNIFIWDENTTEIPIFFLEKPYQEIPENIYKKYSLQNWVKEILP